MKNQFIIKGDTTEIVINSKGEKVKAIISTVDLPLVNSYHKTWCLNGHGYVYMNGLNRGDKAIYLSRVIAGVDDRKETVDHINHNPLDNTRENLRSVSKSQNRYNQGKLDSHNSSGVTGVCYLRSRDKWRAFIYSKGKQIKLGEFKDKAEAIKARKDAEILYWGK